MSSSQSHSHHSRPSQTNSQAFRANNRSTTPMASPRLAHSVGQPYPPKISSAAAGVASDVRSPSPNYFGLNVEPSADRDSRALPRDNWSPPTSSVKSFNPAIPKQVPLDANPEFEAFKRQADANQGKAFSLGTAHFAMQPPPPSSRPGPPRRPTNQSDTASGMPLSRPPLGTKASSRMDIDTDSLHDSAYVSSDSKRNSEASLNPPSFFDMPRQESPAQSDSPFQPMRRSNLSKVEDAHPRLSLPQNKLDQPMTDITKARSETLPSTLVDGGPGLIMPGQLKDMIKNKPASDFLLLDVRVSTHYAQSRIEGALNLCIPTTLLKRATFDLQKLEKTLQTDDDQERFSQWRSAKYLIVYDTSSAEKRDAHSAMNMFKKFSNEGYSGESFLLRGGFDAFAASNPSLIDHQSAAERAGHSSNGGRPTFAPVIGGVTLPSTANNPNPFFSNIRQNMDLADGVGQMDVAVPSDIDSSSLPPWLRNASATADHGKQVAAKFLNIERAEQSRMKDAYAAFNSSTPRQQDSGRVALSGVEKGVKNRYKDILPFEHARVHLADKSAGSCDYINASHVQASRSHKRYIAAQGPLPATFDDFWSVIWDHDVRVIVMLTAESEGGTLKCHPYWTGKEFGPLKLKPLSEKKVSLDIDKYRAGSASSSTSAVSDFNRRRANTTTTLDMPTPNSQPLPTQTETPYVIIRKYAMSHGGHPFAPIREITQLHYPSWPDFGAPAQPSHLLALVELANVMQRSAIPVSASSVVASGKLEDAAHMNWYEEPEQQAQARPMLVHCSAGCGRTGTFCTVDSVIDMLKRQRLARSAASKQQDADGDIDMGEPTPLSTVKDPFARRKSNSHQGKPRLDQTTSGLSVDASWVGDDSLDLIEKTVEDFRGQRLSMVQSLRQFVLCYETTLEWIWRLQERSGTAMKGRGRARSGSLEAPPRR
ncbi:protein-tyrosine phosphatase [Xylariales sp. AK1849]|nr:protein-tyrosine phosphatase [Xylariales sp. AK1849]